MTFKLNTLDDQLDALLLHVEYERLAFENPAEVYWNLLKTDFEPQVEVIVTDRLVITLKRL